ncbi:MAG: hypothetical protein NW200_02330 [Hyphomonadaceae bacterium]|nr:hypothetical protein [Hyphomonadaceae bacterium]
MTHARRTDLQRLRALLLEGRLWLCGALLWLAEAFGDAGVWRARLEADVRNLRRGLRAVLVCLAAADLPSRTAPPGARRPVGAPPGFRRRRHGACLRHVTRVARWRGGSLRAHLAALRAVVDRIDQLVARVRRRLTHCPARAPVLAWSPPAPPVRRAARPVPATDSS